MTLPLVSYPQGEKLILMGRAKMGTQYLHPHGYTDTDDHHMAFLTALNGKDASPVIRQLISLYIANPRIVVSGL